MNVTECPFAVPTCKCYDCACNASYDECNGQDYYIDDCVCDNGLPNVVDARLTEILVRDKVKSCRFESNSAGRRVAEKIQEEVKKKNGVTHIQIKSNFIPEAAASANAEATYSNVEKIMDGTAKDEYATFAQNYTTADGKMFFLPRNFGNATLNTGFVSAVQSKADGTFTTNPVVTLTQEVACIRETGSTRSISTVSRTTSPICVSWLSRCTMSSLSSPSVLTVPIRITSMPMKSISLRKI